jgi:acetyl-CoA carboxylase carboxyl transferase subunit beta
MDKARIPYISLLTDPTTGGVTASYAMLGDFNIAEPNSLIGFAGPRIIRETIGKDLPKGFQSAEFVLEHGFLDFIIDRRVLKSKLTTLLKMLES